jgi:NADH-quinone oxidoreductase subunit L
VSWAWAVVGCPLLTAGVTLIIGRRNLGAVRAVAVSGTTLGLVAAFALMTEPHLAVGTTAVGTTAAGTTAAGTTAAGGLATGAVPLTVAPLVDGLTVAMAVMVAGVALVVQVYSVGYLRADPRYRSYAGFVALFTAAMQLVVVSGDLVVLLVGWEVMGLCSYLLIGHYGEREAAGAAAIKAFVMTRGADAGFVVGVVVLGSAAGSFRIENIAAAAGGMPRATITVGTLLVLMGVVGKSAQFPLHGWLPDAMVGPTPASALIHAATMVAAGVYLVARLLPVFSVAPLTMAVLAVIAALSMVGAAVAALSQDDLKRVLAYSTISQLAYALGALAVGDRDAGVFHLLSHAAFKSLLFLAAGAVIQASGTTVMSRMGGMRTGMPVTFVAASCGFAALVGLPPAVGFFSKDAVLTAAEEVAAGSVASGDVARWAAWLVLVVGVLTAGVTAAYATRAWSRTFLGPAYSPVASLSDPEAVMRWPLVVLAVPVTVGGVTVVAHPGLAPSLSLTVVSLCATAAGASWGYQTRYRVVLLAPIASSGWGQRLAATVNRLAGGVRWVDRRGLHGAVLAVAAGTQTAARVVGRTQTGNVQSYLAVLLGGAVVIGLVAVVT